MTRTPKPKREPATRRSDRLYLRNGIELEVVRPARDGHRTCRCYAAIWKMELEIHYHQIIPQGAATLFYGLTRTDKVKTFRQIRDNGITFPREGDTRPANSAIGGLFHHGRVRARRGG